MASGLKKDQDNPALGSVGTQASSISHFLCDDEYSKAGNKHEFQVMVEYFIMRMYLARRQKTLVNKNNKWTLA